MSTINSKIQLYLERRVVQAFFYKVLDELDGINLLHLNNELNKKYLSILKKEENEWIFCLDSPISCNLLKYTKSDCLDVFSSIVQRYNRHIILNFRSSNWFTVSKDNACDKLDKVKFGKIENIITSCDYYDTVQVAICSVASAVRCEDQDCFLESMLKTKIIQVTRPKLQLLIDCKKSSILPEQIKDFVEQGQLLAESLINGEKGFVKEYFECCDDTQTLLTLQNQLNRSHGYEKYLPSNHSEFIEKYKGLYNFDITQSKENKTVYCELCTDYGSRIYPLSTLALAIKKLPFTSRVASDENMQFLKLSVTAAANKFQNFRNLQFFDYAQERFDDNDENFAQITEMPPRSIKELKNSLVSARKIKNNPNDFGYSTIASNKNDE